MDRLGESAATSEGKVSMPFAALHSCATMCNSASLPIARWRGDTYVPILKEVHKWTSGGETSTLFIGQKKRIPFITSIYKSMLKSSVQKLCVMCTRVCIAYVFVPYRWVHILKKISVINMWQQRVWECVITSINEVLLDCRPFWRHWQGFASFEIRVFGFVGTDAKVCSLLTPSNLASPMFYGLSNTKGNCSLSSAKAVSKDHWL